jgi:hypothetical protein
MTLGIGRARFGRAEERWTSKSDASVASKAGQPHTVLCQQPPCKSAPVARSAGSLQIPRAPVGSVVPAARRVMARTRVHDPQRCRVRQRPVSFVHGYASQPSRLVFFSFLDTMSNFAQFCLRAMIQGCILLSPSRVVVLPFSPRASVLSLLPPEPARKVKKSQPSASTEMWATRPCMDVLAAGKGRSVLCQRRGRALAVRVQLIQQPPLCNGAGERYAQVDPKGNRRGSTGSPAAWRFL